MVGETLGHYRIEAELGSGGMGVVYRAEDLKLGRSVALKFLANGFASDASVRDRFLREARAAAALSHPNICTIYEINDAPPHPFIAMELLEGRTLQQLLASGPLPIADVLDIGAQVADALQAAHAKGLVHRDIKPGNIFITAERRAKVVDFGLAKTTTPATSASGTAADQDAVETDVGDNVLLTRPGTALGTVAYMSPEQARGEAIDSRSDLFSFGAVLYEMATGQRAFDGVTAAIVFDAILNRTPLPPSFINPAVPAELEQVIACAIEKKRDARYQRAADIASDLRRLRRASDPDVRAVQPAFAPTAAGPVSPGWGVTPAGGAQAPGRWKHPRTAVWVALVMVVLAAAGTGAWWFSRKPAMVEGAPILVADIVNRTGDGDFDATLKQALSIKLEESPYLNVVRPQKVQEMLTLMARRPDEAVTPEVGREMCERLGGGALITGEIARFGSLYVLTLAAESCATGQEIGRDQVQAQHKEDVLNALGTALSSMRGRLGESLASIRSHDKPMADATTSSLAALKSFSLGDQKRAAGVDAAAVPYYREAVALDPQFALAWARLGTVYGNIGETELSKECYRKAYDLHGRASDPERLYIMTHYYQTITGDLEKARETYELWHQQYPHDFTPVHNLGVVYESIGDLERALRQFREASALEPASRLARESIAATLLQLGRLDDARETAERELKELGNSPTPHLELYVLDYLAGNRAGMAEHARQLHGTPVDLDRLRVDYEIALREGRFAAAVDILQQGSAAAESQGRVGLAKAGRARNVFARAVVGFTGGTRAEVARELAGSPGDDNVVKLAFALAMAGDTARARALAAPIWPRLKGEADNERVLRPALDAIAALKERRPARALETLKQAVPWEATAKDAPLSAEVRGEAYLALGDGKAAEAEFRKRLDKRGDDPLDFGRVLAERNIGRARALAGDTTGARQAYDEFFRLWKNADADIPLLREARAEYAKLSAS